MTQILRSPHRPRIALSLFLLLTIFSVGSAFAKERRPAAKSKAAAARNDKRSRAERSRGKSVKETLASRRGKSGREARAERGRDSRASARDRRAASKTVARSSGGRALSRRERLQEARARWPSAAATGRGAPPRRAGATRSHCTPAPPPIRPCVTRLRTTSSRRSDRRGMEVRRADRFGAGNHAGSVVVMAPKTGRILPCVNQDWPAQGLQTLLDDSSGEGPCRSRDKVIDPVRRSTSLFRIRTGFDRLALPIPTTRIFGLWADASDSYRMVSYARDWALASAQSSITRTNLRTRPGSEDGLRRQSHVPRTATISRSRCPACLARLGDRHGGSLMTPLFPRTPQEDLKFKPEVRRR